MFLPYSKNMYRLSSSRLPPFKRSVRPRALSPTWKSPYWCSLFRRPPLVAVTRSAQNIRNFQQRKEGIAKPKSFSPACFSFSAVESVCDVPFVAGRRRVIHRSPPPPAPPGRRWRGPAASPSSSCAERDNSPMLSSPPPLPPSWAASAPLPRCFPLGGPGTATSVLPIRVRAHRTNGLFSLTYLRLRPLLAERMSQL